MSEIEIISKLLNIYEYDPPSQMSDYEGLKVENIWMVLVLDINQ